MKTFKNPHSFATPKEHSVRLDSRCNSDGLFVMKEVWKDIPAFKGFYQASNLGRIKRLFTYIKRSRGGTQKKQEQVLKPRSGIKSKYLGVQISIDGKSKSQYVHRLVAQAFFGNSILPVDHINHDARDNRIENLRYCTTRENICSRRIKSKTGFIGVCETKNSKLKFRARIRIGKKLIHLGSFETAKEAGDEYLKAKNKIE